MLLLARIFSLTRLLAARTSPRSMVALHAFPRSPLLSTITSPFPSPYPPSSLPPPSLSFSLPPSSFSLPPSIALPSLPLPSLPPSLPASNCPSSPLSPRPPLVLFLQVLAGSISGRKELVDQIRSLHNVLGGVVDGVRFDRSLVHHSVVLPMTKMCEGFTLRCTSFRALLLTVHFGRQISRAL